MDGQTDVIPVQSDRIGYNNGYPMLNTENLHITAKMLKLIAEIDEFKGSWIALGQIEPERLESLKRVATIESVASSTRIEGATLSDSEVEALLRGVGQKSFKTRDEQEVAGYAAVMEMIFESGQHIRLSENVIKQLHRDLLQFSDKDIRHRGQYKTSPNSVEAFDAEGQSLGVVFQTASPFDTPGKMEELLTWLDEQTQRGELHPLLIIAVFVVVFLEIHPFQDGNGRLSRILTTLLLLQFGYEYVPYSSMESIIEKNKDSYYLALRRTQGTIRTEDPDFQPWILFFLESLQRQKQRLARKVHRVHSVLSPLPELSAEIVEFIREQGRASVLELSRATGRSRNTIKDHLRKLVQAGHLTRQGAGRGTTYSRNLSRT